VACVERVVDVTGFLVVVWHGSGQQALSAACASSSARRAGASARLHHRALTLSPCRRHPRRESTSPRALLPRPPLHTLLRCSPRRVPGASRAWTPRCKRGSRWNACAHCQCSGSAQPIGSWAYRVAEPAIDLE
jgi:hypothetical protein